MPRHKKTETPPAATGGEIEWYTGGGSRNRPGLFVSVGVGGQLRLSHDLSKLWPKDCPYARFGRKGSTIIIQPSTVTGVGFLQMSGEKGREVLKTGVSGLMRQWGWQVEAPTLYTVTLVNGLLEVDQAHPLDVGKPRHCRRKRKGSCEKCDFAIEQAEDGRLKCNEEDSPHFGEIVAPGSTCSSFEPGEPDEDL